mmetsp:Transcript_8339/g.22186  ORF Transcript_8339/g.22186 Transcript_8339/m.22186 type:complete len:277 (+) Transcript_8339:203-1033(+)
MRLVAHFIIRVTDIVFAVIVVTLVIFTLIVIIVIFFTIVVIVVVIVVVVVVVVIIVDIIKCIGDALLRVFCCSLFVIVVIIIVVVVDINVAIIHHCHCPRIFLLDHHIIVFTAAGISCRCNLCATHELFNSLLSFVKRLRTTKLQPVAKAVKDVIDLKLDVHRKRTDTNVCICTRIWSFWLCNVLRIRLAFLLLTILFDNRRQLLLWWRWRTVHRCDAVRLPQDKSLKESHEFVEKQAALRIPANAAMRTSQESADKTNAKAVHRRLVSNVLFGWI